MKRFVVYADCLNIGHAETIKKAKAIAYEYEYECINQDEPYFPVMKINEEELKPEV